MEQLRVLERQNDGTRVVPLAFFCGTRLTDTFYYV